MDAYVYKAALYCENCAQGIKDEIAERRKGSYAPFHPEMLHDSMDYPQGPYGNDAGHADTPQHCDKCGVFLQNPLTEDGRQYVADALVEAESMREPLITWRDFYSINVN